MFGLEIHFGEQGELRQSREVQLGGGFRSFDALVAQFGLGERESIKRLSIRWSDGQETVLDQTLAAGALYRISRRPNRKNFGSTLYFLILRLTSLQLALA